MMYSPEERESILTGIFKRVSEGEAVRNILAEKDQIDRDTFYRWLDDDEPKSKQYARAMADRNETLFEDMLKIADDQSGDLIDPDGEKKPNNTNVNRAKLMIDTRKWMLGKLDSKKYGDKIQNEHSGGIQTDDVSGLSTDELVQRAQAIQTIKDNEDE